MTPAEEAIVFLEAEIAPLARAKPGSADWYLLQAKSLGLSFLRRTGQLKIETPESVDRLRKNFRKEVIKIVDTADGDVVVEPTG